MAGVNSVTAGDASIVIGGTATDPTVETGTLDQVANLHPPAADWSNNSKKITSLANGTGAQDAAAFGQIPTSASQIGGVTSVTAADTSVVVAGTAAAPTVATGTLDVIAAQHPPAASWSNNGFAITGLLDLAVSGLAGAASASRYAGATTSGAPASGTFAIGDFVIDRSGRQWICITAGTPGTWVGSINSVTAADTSIVVAGTTAAPTIATGTLDVIAVQHPPAANWSNNSHKITSLANGSAASDAAAFGQIPLADSTATDITAVGTALAAGSTGKWADAGHVHVDQGLGAEPADISLIAWNMDPALVGATNAITPGTVYLYAIWLRTAQTITNLIWATGNVTGWTCTANECFMALFDSGGTQRGITADQSTPWNTAGYKPAALTSPFAASAGKYYIAILMNGSGTTFTARGGAGSTAVGNAGLAGANLRFAVNGTSQTSMPASITPSSNTGTGSLATYVAAS